MARDLGAHIHTNSWGAPVGGAYDAPATQADDFAFKNREFLILFAAGNEGTGGLRSPGTAKNVLTIGASESVRALPNGVRFPNSPRYPVSDFPHGPMFNFRWQADNQGQVASFSSRGPAQNNRRKPDVVAPGSWILSCRSPVAMADTGSGGLPGTGDEDGIRNHAEAVGLGLPGEPIFRAGSADTPGLPAGTLPGAAQDYMYNSGTSMATPITAGACALLRQYLVERLHHTPSAALLKAMMINGAVDMGMGFAHHDQGWGRIDLVNTLAPAGGNPVFFDDTLSNALTSTQVRSYEAHVGADVRTLAVTLVWRDPAGATIQNRLHLRVLHGTSKFEADAEGDVRNNVQKVVIPTSGPGRYRIEVECLNVKSGIPELPGLRQDYALVVAGGTVPAMKCTPADLSFGSVKLGKSKTRALTISSHGTHPVTVSIRGPAGASPFSWEAVSGIAIPPGANLKLNVSFTPTTAGNFLQRGELFVESNTPGSPQAIRLSGTGWREEPSECNVEGLEDWRRTCHLSDGSLGWQRYICHNGQWVKVGRCFKYIP